jgi:tetratricopeptide (TPR) repeat protein
MEFLERLSERPALALIVVGIVLGVLVVVRALRGGAPKEEAVPGLEALIAAGRLRDAAMLCLRHERFDLAQEYFLRANEPARAAQVAQRLGNHKLAAELYERGGELRKAAACYERVGLLPKAQELLNAAVERDGKATQGADAPKPAARSAGAQYQEIKAKGAADDAGRIETQQAAQRAGEEALAAGNIRAAAEIYRDAGLADEAIHLYANVLGAPGDAAPLVASRGLHDRAAELYELAGQKDRAAAAWVDMARKDGRVEAYVDRVERLDARAALRMLEDATGARTLTEDSAELYYRFGDMLERLGERVRALEVMQSLQRTVAGYKDVEVKVRALSAARSPRNTPAGEAPARPAAQAHAAATAERGEAAPPSTVVVQHFQVAGDVRPVDLQALAKEAARAASAHLGGQSGDGDGRGPSVVLVHAGGDAQRLELLHDGEVRAAREGPSLEALRRYVGDTACTLKNIEVYYKMGLVCLANGDWGAALEHFRAVDEASPGYRDASARASEIRKWQSSMSGKSSVASGILQGGAQNASRYALHGELGRGGMAVVYRATDTVLGRDVALKFIADEALGRKEFREMFLREARSVAQLNHPNIVTIFDVGALEGRTFIAMELVEGQTVDQLVVEQKKLPVVEALRVTLQVLQALEYAHGRQIIHRDIKPSNMMRTASGMVKLMDFGLAKSLDHSAKASVIAGTPAYMPPEQFAGQNVDHRADLYAVGVSLFEMLTGEIPFPSPLRTGEAPSVRALVPQVPALVDDVLRRVLDVDPARRFQSAQQLAAPLQKVLGVFARAQEEREARHTHPQSASANTAPLGGAPTQAAQRPLILKAPTQAAPVSAAAPKAPAPPATTAVEKTSEVRKKTMLMAAAQASSASPAPTQAAPVATPSGATHDTWSVPPKAPMAFQSKKGTMLMHAAPPSAARSPSPSSAASDTGPGARKATMMMGAAQAASAARRSSTIPPPA